MRVTSISPGVLDEFPRHSQLFLPDQRELSTYLSHVAGAWTERKKMFLGGSFLILANDDV